MYIIDYQGFNSEYKEQDDFIEAIKLQIGENDTLKYQGQILQSCCVAVSDENITDIFKELEIENIAEKVSDKLNWLYKFEHLLSIWNELVLVCEITCSFVRKHGFYLACEKQLKTEFELNKVQSNYKQITKLQERLLDYLKFEGSKCKANEKLLGSSEIIESIFGTQKQLEKQQVKSGFTKLILAIAARISKTTMPIVKKAMETISIKKLDEWSKK